MTKSGELEEYDVLIGSLPLLKTRPPQESLTCVSSCVHYSNHHIFVNRLSTYRVSTCLTICHTSKVLPRRRYDYVILVKYYSMLVSALSPL